MIIYQSNAYMEWLVKRLKIEVLFGYQEEKIGNRMKESKWHFNSNNAYEILIRNRNKI